MTSVHTTNPLILNLSGITLRALFFHRIQKRNHPYPQWFNSSIRHQLHKVHTPTKKCSCNLSSHNLTCLSSTESSLQAEISDARTNFESSLVHDFVFSNDSKIYDYIGTFSMSGGFPLSLQYQSQLITSAPEKAHAFKTFSTQFSIIVELRSLQMNSLSSLFSEFYFNYYRGHFPCPLLP